MASFGFSIGDIILISNYAYSVYKSCQNAGENFREITSDVASLRTLLLALDDECKNPQSSFQHLPLAQKGELAARLQDCKADLRSVKKILHDFRSLDRHDARHRDRLAFTTGKQAAIREKIATHSVRLQQLLTGINVGTFSRIERNTEAHYLSLLEIRAKLDRIHMDVLAGRRDATMFMNSEDAVALEDEVLDDNMTEVDVDVSYEVHAWVERVHSETSQPLSTPDNDVVAIEDDGSSSSNSSDTCSVQELSNTDSPSNDSHIRGESPDSSGDGSDTDEQNSQSEGVQESLEAHKAPEGGATPHFISDLEQEALRYRPRPTPTKPSKKEQLALRYQKRTTPTEPSDLEAHEPPDDGYTPRFISDLGKRTLRYQKPRPTVPSNLEAQALPYQTKSKHTNSFISAEYEGTLIDLRDCQRSDITVVKYEESYQFDEQDKSWVRQRHRYGKLRVRESSVVLKYVDVTLEEVLAGTTKYLTVRRSTVNPRAHDSKPSEDIKISLEIKPGVLNGDAVCYAVRTDPFRKHVTTLRLKFRRKPHMLFEDVGADIVHRIHLSSAEKKKGWERNGHNIDGKLISVHADGPLAYGHFLALNSQGLPYSKRPSKRGLLIFEIGDFARSHAGFQNISGKDAGFCAQLDESNTAAFSSTSFLEPHHLAVLKALKRPKPELSEA